MEFSEHLQLVTQSETFRIFSLIKEKLAIGEDIIQLVAGELDEPTSTHIANAGIEAIKRGKTKYTVNNGIPELRNAICNKIEVENNVKYSPEQILVSNGGKHALFNCLYSLCGHNDEVIIISPYYASYPDMIKLTGAKPVIIDTQDNCFLPTKEMLESAITKRTKAIIINSPSNPTGLVLDSDTMSFIAQLVKKHSLWLLSDEIYEKILYPPTEFHSPIEVDPTIYDRTIILNSFSKTYAMTGWRIGYAAGPTELINKAGLVQSQTTSNASSISQYAALEALNSENSFLKELIPKLQDKRDMAIQKLNLIKNIEVIKPQGAFYLFVKVSDFYRKKSINTSYDFAMYFLEKHHVGIVPGSAFGADDHIRISFASSKEQVSEGLNRIISGLSEL